MWFFYIKRKRFQRTLPRDIKTREQAETFTNEIKNTYLDKNMIVSLDLKRWSFVDDVTKIEKFFLEAYDFYKNNFSTSMFSEIKQNAKNIHNYLIEIKISPYLCLNPTPDLIIDFLSTREKLIRPKRLNKELYAYSKIHEFWVSKGYSIPLSFDMYLFYSRDRSDRTNFSEKFFELLIKKYPTPFLDEELEFIEKPIAIDNLLPDALFSMKDGSYIVVEIQKYRLDRDHAYKILEYRDKLEHKLAKENNVNIRMIEVIIGDKCTLERKQFLEKYGIELKILPIEKIEGIMLNLLGIDTKLRSYL